MTEVEPDTAGRPASIVTVFLTNRECPWRCVMCDLWKNTLPGKVPSGAIPAQIDAGFRDLGIRIHAQSPPPSRSTGRSTFHPPPSRIPSTLKLYNSGSFFDPQAIPPEDYRAVAERCRGFGRVIVECHPALVDERVLPFRDMLNALDPPARLEAALGLETAHPQVLEKLNKRMTLDLFRRAADFLRGHDIDLRVFVLVKPPFIIDEDEALDWACRSVTVAFDCGASVVSLIPTRLGNGALEALARLGQFAPPRLATLEAALDFGLGLGRGRVFADLWDLEKFSDCAACHQRRDERLREMNLRQVVLPQVRCPSHEGRD